jgi:hypothetical protein
MPSIGSIGGKDDARGKHFCTCHEFTNALTEVLAENAVGLARRGRLREHTRPSDVIPNTMNMHYVWQSRLRLCGGKLYKTILHWTPKYRKR